MDVQSKQVSDRLAPFTGSTNHAHTWRIRTMLIWLVLGCLLPGTIGATILFLREYWAGRDQLMRNTLATARALTQAVDTELSKAMVIAQTLSNAGALARGDLPKFHARATILIAQTKAGTNVVVSDETGQQVLNTLRPFGEPLPLHGNLALLKQVFSTQQAAISDMYLGAVSHKPTMSIDVPVIVDGKVKYDLSVGLASTEFARILTTQNLPPDWVAAVLDRNGTIIARTHAPEKFVGQKGTAEFIKRVREVPEGSIESITREGIRVVSIWSRSPATGWSVGIGIPRENLEQELVRTLTGLGVSITILLILGLALAWAAARRIASAVHGLTASAITLGEGELVGMRATEIKETDEAALALGRASKLLHEKTATLLNTNRTLADAKRELLDAHRLARFGSWQWNLKTRTFTASDSLHELIGSQVPAPREQRGTLLSEETWDRLLHATREMLHTRIPYDLEFDVYRKEGAVLRVNGKCEPVYSSNDEIVALRGTIQDISRRKQAEEKLKASEARFRATFEQSAIGLAHISLDSEWLLVNDKLCTILGYDRAVLTTLTLRDITHFPDRELDRELMAKLLAHDIPYYWVEKRFVRCDGTLVWVNMTVALVRHELDSENYFVLAVEDIQARKEVETALEVSRAAHEKHLEQQVEQRTAELQAANAELQRVVRQDVLTGLQNRISANERLREEFLRMKRTGEPYAVLFMDIDHFKVINDTYGHETGDHVLRHVADVFRHSLRGSDFVARFGGEEFLALLPNTAQEGAATIAEKLRQTIEGQAFAVVGRITISIGVSCAHPADTNEEMVVKRADVALYEAKRGGRNRIHGMCVQTRIADQKC